MAKSKDSGRDAFRRRQKKNEIRTVKAIDRQQMRIKWFSILVVVAAIVFATMKTIAVSSHTSTDAADWRLPKLIGKGYKSLSSYKGKPLVVMYFSSTCSNCRDEFAPFMDAVKNHSDKAHWIAVDTLETNRTAAIKMARDNGLDKTTVLRDIGAKNGALHATLNAPGPFALVYYDSKGEQANVQNGPIPAASFAGYVTEVLKDPPPPPTTQPQSQNGATGDPNAGSPTGVDPNAVSPTGVDPNAVPAGQ